MRPLSHLITSGLIGILVAASFKSAWHGIASFLSGIFIDLDHLIDYYLNHSFTLNSRRVYETCRELNLKKIYLLLHSYELIALLWATIYIFSLSNLWRAITIGFTQHIIFDQLTNPLNTFGYFLTYRIIKGFDKNLIIRESGESGCRH